MAGSLGILAVAAALPEETRPAAELLREEGASVSPALLERLGVQSVHLARGQTASALAVEAARRALDAAGADPASLDLIVDYSTLPQEMLAPAWNMSNKIQAELGAKNAWTVGFSGAGASGLLLALDCARAVLGADEGSGTALLLGADVTIPGNRVLNPENPVAVMGDGASAVVVSRAASKHRVIGMRLRTNGANHDAYRIEGGGMTNPLREDLYRLCLDPARAPEPKMFQSLAALCGDLLADSRLRRSDLQQVIYTDISNEDRESLRRIAEIAPGGMAVTGLVRRGHVQASDLAFNLQQALAGEVESPNGAAGGRGPLLLCSHGFGFTFGAALIER